MGYGVHDPRIVRIVMLLVVTSITMACRRHTPVVVVPGGDPERGRTAIADFHCGACHTIAGVVNADGRVGPPLTGVAERTMIAGELPNTPADLVRWIQDPPSVEPKTAMPNLHVDARTARDIAAYLYTLR